MQRRNAVPVGTYGANARHDPGHVLHAPAAHEALEKADALEDVELDLADVAAFKEDFNPTMPFNAGQVIN
jgi:hypothetical protein